MYFSCTPWVREKPLCMSCTYYRTDFDIIADIKAICFLHLFLHSLIFCFIRGLATQVLFFFVVLCSLLVCKICIWRWNDSPLANQIYVWGRNKSSIKPNQHEIIYGERAFPLGLHLMINLIISPFLIKTVGLTGMGEHFAFSRDKLIE